jgi:hypothetical protein
MRLTAYAVYQRLTATIPSARSTIVSFIVKGSFKAREKLTFARRLASEFYQMERRPNPESTNER